MHLFSTLLKHQKTLRFSDVFASINTFYNISLIKDIAPTQVNFLLLNQFDCAFFFPSGLFSMTKQTCFHDILRALPAGNYMFKVNNRNTRTRCETCSKLTTKTFLFLYGHSKQNSNVLRTKVAACLSMQTLKHTICYKR